jgi:2-amino-4-hydroxy-6-hydroxymethyldihydropteridine diphosphokinase
VSHYLLISVGSNIEKEKNTLAGLDALEHHFDSVSISTIYESESVGFDGNNFLNLVVAAQTSMDVAQVCQVLKEIEDKSGRIRDKKFGNRTLDLDLLTFDDLICDTPVVLPRGEIEHNAFVLKPMAELVPNQIHPTTGRSYAQLWESYHNPQQRLWPAALTWSPANR